MADSAYDLFNPEAVTPIILLAEHAGRLIPADCNLGLAPELLEQDRNLPFDYGVAGVTQLLADKLGAMAILGRHSRLWVDLNRAETSPDLIPQTAHGHAIPGNYNPTPEDRADRIGAHRAYHAMVAQQIERHLAAGITPLLFSIHSFTPTIGLAQSAALDAEAPHVGLLYLEEHLPVQQLRKTLQAAHVKTADNFPYDLRLVPPGGLHIHGARYSLPVMGVEISIDRLQMTTDEQTWADLLFNGLNHFVQSATV